MAVKMPLVNVSPQVSVDVCIGDGSGPMPTARGGGVKMALFADIHYGCNEPVSYKLSWNLSHKNAKL